MVMSVPGDHQVMMVRCDRSPGKCPGDIYTGKAGMLSGNHELARMPHSAQMMPGHDCL